MIKLKERKSEIEETDMKASFDNFENKREFSVSNKEILDVIDSRSLESRSGVSDGKTMVINGMLASNIMDSEYFDNEIINNKLENAYNNYIDYEGITTYSILARPEVVMESIVADEYPNTIRQRLDEDIESYKHPMEVTELGIDEELEYEYKRDKILRDSEEWISPFKTFKSEI